jgi:integrating conjugative element protein (TIGR03761 family)
MNILWQAAADDDPYADWWLIRVEEAIATAQAYFATERVQVDSVALETFRFRVGISQSRRPQTLMLQFATPHAYRAAQLLGEYDALVCQCLTLKHVGACPSSQMSDLIALGAHRLRSVFSLPQGYRVFAINRTDVQHNIQRAQQASAHFGELPSDILSGDRTPFLAPLRTALGQSEPDLLPGNTGATELAASLDAERAATALPVLGEPVVADGQR